MNLLRSVASLVCAAGVFTLVAAEPVDHTADPVKSSENLPAPLYFSAAEEAVQSVTPLLAAGNWATLSRYYDLSLTAGVERSQLLDGGFFVDATKSPTGPGAVTRWLRPFPPGAKFVEAKPLGDPSRLPCIWMLRTLLSIDQGGGPVQRVVSECRLLQTKDGFQFLPPAPTERPAPAPVTAQQWSAQGADHILLYRPQLGEQAKAEVPAGRSSNIPLLVQAIERLRPRAAVHPGRTHLGSQPWEPAMVYEPTDEELLLSLAGDRIWRSLQLAPPGILAQVRRDNPSLTADAIEYPHIEIVRVEVAGTGPRLYAKAPELRRLNLHVP